MKKLLVLICVCLSIQSFAQKRDITKNNLYIHTGTFIVTNAIGATLERNLIATQNTEINLGVSFAKSFGINNDFNLYNAKLIFVTGTSSAHLEYSVGALALQNVTSSNYNYSPSTYLGFRYKKPDGHVLFRMGIGWPQLIGIGVGVSI